MHVNGASRCPICNKEPLTYTDTLHDQLTVIECPPHGFVALGRGMEQAIDNWNRLIEHRRTRAVPQVSFDPPALSPTLCPHCQMATGGKLYRLPERSYVECDICHQIKHERAPNRPKMQNRYDGPHA